MQTLPARECLLARTQTCGHLIFNSLSSHIMRLQCSSWNACREHPLPADVLSAVRCPWKQFDETRFLPFPSFAVLLLQRHGRLI